MHGHVKRLNGSFKSILTSSKIVVHDAIIRFKLLYRLERVAFNASIEHQLNVLQLNCLPSILNSKTTILDRTDINARPADAAQSTVEQDSIRERRTPQLQARLTNHEQKKIIKQIIASREGDLMDILALTNSSMKPTQVSIIPGTRWRAGQQWMKCVETILEAR